MKFATIKGHTHAPGAPAKWDPARDGSCGALPIRVEVSGVAVGYREPVVNHPGALVCKSAWKPTFEEILMLIGGGYVELTVAGWQVPVSLKTIEKHEAME